MGHCVIFTKIQKKNIQICFLVCCCSWVVQAEETPSSAIKYHGVGDVITFLFFYPPVCFRSFSCSPLAGLKSRRPPLIRIYVYEKELFDCLSTAIGSMYRRLRGLDERLPCIVVAYTSQRSLEAYIEISLLFSFFRVHSGTKVVESGRKVIVCKPPRGKRKEEKDPIQ